ncbi:hypothetical protein [Frankia sp. Cj3]|uniref:hypothetical protein n=1 Tax=Frankia sp. Cj3 TaxID=2880976 RepID=UPI001EF423C4|nr:hypothetical protein [Frankia sp. Cj3]
MNSYGDNYLIPRMSWILDPSRKWWTRTPERVAAARLIAARVATEAGTAAKVQAVTQAVAEGRDRELEGWRPLLERAKLPAYVAKAIPEHVLDWHRQTTG